MPAGDATEFGRMKSSRFIGSECCVFEWSTDLRSWAIPLGAEVVFFNALYNERHRLMMILFRRLWRRLTVLAFAPSSSGSSPSFSRSDSPFVLGSVTLSLFCCIASISASPEDPFSASRPGCLTHYRQHHLSNQGTPSRVGVAFAPRSPLATDHLYRWIDSSSV